MNHNFKHIPTRKAALARLEDFISQVGRYGFERNYDRGFDSCVSRLSPWIRRRVITEREIADRVLSSFKLEICEKFIQELLWRTYWKGCLEKNPHVWTSFISQNVQLSAQYQENKLYIAAINAKTDLTFFNDWVTELVSSGYLHNHTRMWFASVWIFTLKLPWQLGAMFMLQHLLDGDPASNTLSWRWVAGLQTQGKIYLARPDNIEKYSEGRWKPKASELELNPEPIEQDNFICETVSEFQPKVSTAKPNPDALFLIHDDDFMPEHSCDKAQVLILSQQEFANTNLREFVSGLREDAKTRFDGLAVSNAQELVEYATQKKTKEIVTMLPHVGPERDSLLGVSNALKQVGIELIFLQNKWDSQFFSMATKGYFQFWKVAREAFGGERISLRF